MKIKKILAMPLMVSVLASGVVGMENGGERDSSIGNSIRSIVIQDARLEIHRPIITAIGAIGNAANMAIQGTEPLSDLAGLMINRDKLASLKEVSEGSRRLFESPDISACCDGLLFRLANFLCNVEAATGIEFEEDSADNFAACIGDLPFGDGRTLSDASVTDWLNFGHGIGFVKSFGELWGAVIDARGGRLPEGMGGIEILGRLGIQQPQPVAQQPLNGVQGQAPTALPAGEEVSAEYIAGIVTAGIFDQPAANPCASVPQNINQQAQQQQGTPQAGVCGRESRTVTFSGEGIPQIAKQIFGDDALEGFGFSRRQPQSGAFAPAPAATPGFSQAGGMSQGQPTARQPFAGAQQPCQQSAAPCPPPAPVAGYGAPVPPPYAMPAAAAPRTISCHNANSMLGGILTALGMNGVMVQSFGGDISRESFITSLETMVVALKYS